jgi:hypothetical protein
MRLVCLKSLSLHREPASIIADPGFCPVSRNNVLGKRIGEVKPSLFKPPICSNKKPLPVQGLFIKYFMCAISPGRHVYYTRNLPRVK